MVGKSTHSVTLYSIDTCTFVWLFHLVIGSCNLIRVS